MSSIGIFIKERRNQLGLTGTELAKLIGSTSACISNWERDVTRGPSKEFLAPLAKALQVTVDDLIAKQSSTSTQDQLSSDERELLSIYRNQGVLERTMILRMLKGLKK